MSQYGTIYRMQWQMMSTGNGITSGDIVRADISPTDYLIEDDETPTIIPMTPSGQPLLISVIDNDEDKFTPIRSKQAVMEVVSGNGIDINTFAVGSDNLWIVTITLNPDGAGTVIFKGYLSLADLEQSYLPDPVIIRLTATDHLGMLKDINLVDFNDDVPQGKYKIGELIAMCLRKTGLDLNIRVINNLRHGSGQITITGTSVSFNAPENIMLFSGAYLPFFYPGQQFTVSGSASNDGTYTVIDTALAGAPLVGIGFALVAEDLTDEVATDITLTDESSGSHIYDIAYLDAKTFESTIGECHDCYNVLTKILGEDCTLFQYRGEWWIVRLDEIEALSVYVALFNSLGEYQSIEEKDYTKSIGSSESHRFANADQIIALNRPHGFVKETYRFDYPAEIICNIDYSRGDETDDPDVQQSGYTAFELDCWTAKRLWGDNAEAAQIKAAILRAYDAMGYEKRFIMLTQPTTNEDAFNYIESSAVPIIALDKFRFSFNISAMTNPSGDGLITCCYVLLYGIDGTVWTLDTVDTSGTWINTDGEVPLTWRQTNAEFTLFRGGLQWAMFTDQDKTEWASCIIVAPPAPVSGDLRFMLCAADQSDDSFDSFNVRYQNIDFVYQSYLAGEYIKYVGLYNKVDRLNSDYLAKREKEVFIADAPSPMLKGAMFIARGVGHALTSRWFTANTFALGYPPSMEYIHPYGYIQAYAVWNQHNLVVRKFTGSILGFGEDWPDIVHKYTLTDANPNADNRKFVMVTFEQDWKLGMMTATLIECYNSETGHVYSDDHELKYITS